MNSNEHIKDSLTRHQIYLLRYAGTTSKKVNTLTKKLLKETNRRLKLKGKTEFTIRELFKLKLDLINFANNLNYDKVIKDSVKELTEYEVKYMEKLLNVSTIEAAVINNIAPEMVISSVNTLPMRLAGVKGAKSITQLIKIFSDSPAREISSIIQFGIANGDSIETIARAVQFKGKTKLRRDARATVRTIVNHTGSVARSAVVKENSHIISKEEYVATLDRATTILCGGYDGKTFDLDKGPFPPLHYQ